MIKKTSFFLLGTLIGISVIAQNNTDQNNLWLKVNEEAIPETGTRYIVPTEYRVGKLDVASMRVMLNAVPVRSVIDIKKSNSFIDIPLPEGGFETFKIVEAPVMAPSLQTSHPEIRAYTGISINNGSRYLKLDLTPQGFHAMVLAPSGTIFIDPYSFGGGDIEHYIIYYKKTSRSSVDKTFECLTDGVVEAKDPTIANKSFGSCELRTYRLALAATGEYTVFHGGTVALAAAAQVTTMNRVNGMFERDGTLTMVIVAGNDNIIFTNGGTDPYTNNNGGAMLGENQTECDNTIGSANYDIGHVFSTGGGGVAFLQSPCNNSIKAGGVTGSGSPIGDSFDIDYVAHEMGHQYGGNHTQNNGCNRNGATAMEPGSASSIMGYAGICAPNVQNNSDALFHGISMQEIGNFVTGAGDACPTKTTLTNNAPLVTSTNGNVTIPISTPFSLTAVATDADGDVLTYSWEQMNNEVTTQPPSATATGGPNFRTFLPTTDPTRYFPNLPDVIAGVSPTWEVLPSVSRTMDFWVMVRDNSAGAGCNAWQEVTVTTDASAGPFLVTYPSVTGITWAGNTNETVTWDVANTDGGSVACANVDILLSTDGGLTFPTTLASGATNDGSQSISVPNTATTTAIIMVMCNNGTFFDVSDNVFEITASTFDYTLSVTPTSVSVCPPADGTYTVDVGSIGGYSDDVTLSVSGLPGGTSASFSANPVTPLGSSTLTISGTGSATPGSYTLTITGNSTSGTKTVDVTLIVSDPSPSAVTLLTPTDAASGVAIPTDFTWSASAAAGAVYDIDISTNSSFSSIVDNATGLPTNAYTSSVLSTGTTYYWRVLVSTACGSGSYSSTFSFTTSFCSVVASTDVPVAISASGTPTVTSTITIPVSGVINNVNVLNLTGTHSWISDLTITLTSPSGTIITLFGGICTNLDNFDLNFDDAGAAGGASIPCPPTDGGTYQPTNPFSNFNGEDPSGVWTLTISDAFDQDGGSLDSWSLEVCVDPPVCAVSVTSTAVSCNGNSDGTASATPTSGTSPYSYAWSNSATTQNISGLAPGSYTVTMTDGTTCTSTASISVSEPVVLSGSTAVTTITCNGNSDGIINLTVSGGTTAYTYLWSNAAVTEDISGLAPGAYSVTITDANSCVTTTSATVSEPVVLSITVTGTNSSCGDANGFASASSSGGTTPHSYAWSSGGNSATETGLSAGTYTITVTDNNSCIAIESATITDTAGPTASTSVTDETCGNTNGTATSIPSGGTTPYAFAWSSGGSAQTESGQAASTITISITDANTCLVTASATINNIAGPTAS
ncbi:MAG: proprotein convertase P-domain-containing protein, partial [Flavobacteriales bacterium]|nr:proprotein convertase P-domain-containing protein [Flavobacteriales bacterium]